VTQPKTPAQRQAALKARRIAAGLIPRRIYAHADDWPVIKALADRLQRKRAHAKP